MRPGTTEYGIHVMFNPGLQAHHPLGAHDKLGSPTFPIPFSFIYGDSDWTVQVDEDAAQKCVIQNQKMHGRENSNRY